MRDHRPDPESPGPACQPHGPSDPSVSRSGGVVDIASTRTLASVARDSWSTARVIGGGREASGQQVDPAGHRTQSRSPKRAGQIRGPSDTSTSRPGVLVDTAGTRTRSGISQESWWTPRFHGPKQESFVSLVDPAGHRTQAESCGRAVRHRSPWSKAPGHPGHLFEPAGPQAWARDSRAAGRQCGPSTGARVARDGWATPQDIGGVGKSPGRAGRPHGP